MIYLYTLDGKVEGEFTTQKEIAELLGKSRAAISRAIKGEIKTVNNYVISRGDFLSHVIKYDIPIVVNCFVIYRDGVVNKYAKSLLTVASELGIKVIEAFNLVQNSEQDVVRLETVNIETFDMFLDSENLNFPTHHQW